MKQKVAIDLTERLLGAFNAQIPLQALRAELIQLRTEGHEKEVLLTTLEKCRTHLQQTNRENDEDTVLEAMDYLVGWCSPHMEIS